MRYLIFLLILVTNIVQAQVTSGFIVLASGSAACGTVANTTIPVYWNGTLVDGSVLYTNPGRTTPYNGDWNTYYLRSTSGSGEANAYFYITPGSGVIGNFKHCGGLHSLGTRNYPAACDSVRISTGEDMLVRRPSDYDSSYNANRKYPVIIFTHGNGETGTNLNLMYNAGMPRVLTLSQNVGNPLMDSIIYVMPQHSSNAQTWRSPPDVKAILDFIDLTYRVDTNRMAFGGLSQGGVNAIDLFNWSFSSFYGANAYFTKLNRLQKLYILSSPSMNTADTTFRLNGRRFRSWIGLSDASFLSQHRGNITHIQAKGVQGEVYEIPGAHNNTVWDSAMSLRGVDTLTNIHRWVIGPISAPENPTPPTIQQQIRFTNRRRISA